MLNKLRKLQKSEAKGFTIIEVMIVLAIAGLILLIVFLAVPALQRTARNTQRKNDAAAIGSALSSYESNNGGQNANTSAYAAGIITFTCTAGGPATGCSASNNSETAKVGFYTSNPTLVYNQANPTAPTTTSVTIDVGYGCNAAGTGIGSATPRDAAVLYMLEPNTTECVEE